MSHLPLLHTLVQGWLDCAQADEADAEARHEVSERFKSFAVARRNCAWELQRLLRQVEKENPPWGGSLLPESNNELEQGGS